MLHFHYVLVSWKSTGFCTELNPTPQYFLTHSVLKVISRHDTSTEEPLVPVVDLAQFTAHDFILDTKISSSCNKYALTCSLKDVDVSVS